MFTCRHVFVWIVPLIFSVLIFIPIATAQVAASLSTNPCSSQLTCGQCLTSPGCGWCFQLDFNPGHAGTRCDHLGNLLNLGCNETAIFYPKSSWETVKETTKDSNNQQAVFQLNPTEIKLQLRQNEPVFFNVTFKQAENYPLDLYYLMDLTFSMKEHKDRLAELAETLANSMSNLTKNFRIGFGSFIDKIVMPYADMFPSRLANPCRDYSCSAGYGFRNHLPLNQNFSRFTYEVAQANLSGNLDNAEGGFDAIMQAIVCQDHINWKEISRKIVVFATDSMFHYAGDGKLGGIVKINDGECHIDSNGYYTESVHQDYPSLSQINNKASQHKVNLIFAVPEDRVSLYDRLSSLIEGAYTGKLSGDSSNIVDLIKNQYEKIRSEVILKDNSPDFINVKYSSRCLGKSKDFGNECKGLKIGDEVTFELEVELLSCPLELYKMNQSFTISPVGLIENLMVNFDIYCQCPCESLEQQEPISPYCSMNGTQECGLCLCNPNHFGSQCQCTGDDIVREDLQQHCKMEKESKFCSARGECVCGKCNCYSGSRPEDRIYGQFCECDTFSCARDSENQVCGGIERGKCCGQCLCQSGWSGDACDCSMNNSTCIHTNDLPENGGNGRICSGHGECICGACKCTQDSRGRHAGPFCEDCSACEGRCTEFRSCVECQVFQTGSLSEKGCDACSVKPTVVDSLVDSPGERNCIFKDEQDCTFEFQYSYDVENLVIVRVKKTKDCPQHVDLVWLIVGVSGGVFFIGLIIILVLRLCIYLKDRRDYKIFLDDVKNTEWGQETNPLYKKAVSKFENPMYKPSPDN